MGKYLKLFETHSQYTAFTQTEDFILPNVSYCKDQTDIVHYNPIVVETRLMVTYNVEDASEPTQLYFYNTEAKATGVGMFGKVEIDGTEVSVTDLDGNNGSYQLSVGEHTVAYTLKDPTNIGNGAFYNCSNLTNISIPNGVTSIGDYAFAVCSSLASITIPNSVTSIGTQAFTECIGLISITIGNGVTNIGDSAFYYCSGLTSVTIGDSVTSIGNQAFYYCSKLESITSLATTAPTIQSNTFLNVKTNGTLTVPSGSTGYDVWMGTGNYYLGKYSWTKVEQ